MDWLLPNITVLLQKFYSDHRRLFGSCYNDWKSNNEQTFVINTDHNGKTSNVIIRHNITYKNSMRNWFFTLLRIFNHKTSVNKNELQTPKSNPEQYTKISNLYFKSPQFAHLKSFLRLALMASHRPLKLTKQWRPETPSAEAGLTPPFTWLMLGFQLHLSVLPTFRQSKTILLFCSALRVSALAFPKNRKQQFNKR